MQAFQRLGVRVKLMHSRIQVDGIYICTDNSG